MKRSLMLSVPLAALFFSTVGPAGAASTSAQDSMFVQKAAQGGMTEVKLAQLALAKSKNPAVYSFATHMRDDHTKGNSQLMALVNQKGMTAPADIGPANRAIVEKLEGVTGSVFEVTYLKSQLPAHRKMLTLFKKEAAMGSDPDLIAFAQQTIPVIVAHIAMDKRDIAQMGAAGVHTSMSMK